MHKSFFNGLLYAHGQGGTDEDIRIQNATVNGAVVANGKGPGGSTLVVEDSTVLYSEAATSLEVELGVPELPVPPRSGYGNLPGDVTLVVPALEDFLVPGPPPAYVWDPSLVKLEKDGVVYDEAADVPGLGQLELNDATRYLEDARSLMEPVVTALEPPEDPDARPVGGVFELDLNRYLNTEGRLESLYWQRL